MVKNSPIFTDKDRTMKISVLLTDYLQHDFLLETLESVILQNIDKTSYELILLTDESNAEIREILKQNAIDHKIIETGLKHWGEAIHIGLENSDGDVICFLDNDDIWNPEKLVYVKRYFERFPDLVFMKDMAIPFMSRNGSNKPTMLFKTPALGRPNKSNPQYIKLGESIPVRSLFRHRILFNNSSMSIKRDAISFMKTKSGNLSKYRFT